MALNQGNIPLTEVDGGLKQDKSAVVIAPKFTPSCNNVVIHDGVVEKRTGLVWYRPSSDWSANEPDDIHMAFYHHEDFTNSNKRFWTFGFTNEADDKHYLRQHYLNLSSNTWTNIAHGTPKAIVDATFNANDYWVNFCEVIDDENDAGTADNEYLIVNVTPLNPSDTTAGLEIQKIEDVDGTPTIVDVTGSPPKCKRILTYFHRLLLFGTGTDLNEVKWSQALDHDDFSGAGSSNGFLFDTAGKILNAELLKDTVVCYKEDSLWTGTRLTDTPYIRWSQSYPDVGLFAPRLLTQWGNFHIFVGTNNIYLYAGGGELYPIGTPIWTSFLKDMRDGGVAGNDNQLYRNRSFASVHRDKGDICFWIVSGTSSWPNVAYVWNMFQKTWTRWSLPDNASSSPTSTLALTGWGEYEHDKDITDAEFIPFYGGAKMTISGGALSDLKVMRWDYTTFTDVDPAESNGTQSRPINARWETKTIVGGLEEEPTWAKVVVEMKGLAASSTAIISMSLTDGFTFKDSSGSNPATETISLNADNFTTHSVKFNLKGYSSRFRVEDATSAKGFALRLLEVIPTLDERVST